MKAALSPQQKANIKIALARAKNASPRERKALIEAMGVESNYQNLPGGDRDSTGVLQQRRSQGWPGGGVAQQTDAFLAAARKANTVGGSAGSLAQRVQRSGFPLKYGEHSAEANAILKGKGSGGTSRSASGSPNPGAASALIEWLQNRQKPGATLALAGSLGSLKAAGSLSTTIPQTKVTLPGTHSVVGHTVAFGGKQVAGWIAPILEYARAHGWKGNVNSGFRSDAEQAKIYASGVRPAAKPKSLGGGGSNHSGSVYPLGAIDVSEAASLSQILKDSPYASKLQWAGSKDPVHFSHPHGGSY